MKAIRCTYRLYQRHIQYIIDLAGWLGRNKSEVVRQALTEMWQREATKRQIHQYRLFEDD